MRLLNKNLTVICDFKNNKLKWHYILLRLSLIKAFNYELKYERKD